MDFDEQRSERKMFKGDWKCGKCGTAIDKLPFEPNPNALDRLLCKDCYRMRQDNFRR